MSLKAFVIDTHHAIMRCVDKDERVCWIMIRTNNPIKDNVISGDAGFDYWEIDPDDFEFNGRSYKLIHSVKNET